MLCRTSLLPTVRVLGREREGGRKGREGGRKEGREGGRTGCIAEVYDLVCRSAADGCWSEPVY